MSSWQVKKMCLSCRHFRLRDELSGVCRENKVDGRELPLKLCEDVCEQWVDCGQQFYIRKGWIKGRSNRKDKKDIQ